MVEVPVGQEYHLDPYAVVPDIVRQPAAFGLSETARIHDRSFHSVIPEEGADFLEKIECEISDIQHK